jgi:protein tyrosine phosphatase (PTP) superfamily phosphohydrolase (DUF442 family)
MFRLRWLQAGGGTRGKPRRDRTHRKPWPLFGLIACLALLQSGCQSGPFSNCGTGCGSGLFSPCGFFGRVSSRVFNRGSRGADCCEPGGVISGAPVEYGAPSGVIAAPSSMGVTPSVVPSYQGPSGTISSPSSVPPLPSETPPSTLEPIENAPKSRIGPPGNGASSAAPSGKTSYQTRRADPNSRLARRPVTLPGTQVSTPEPTSRSAQALSRQGNRNYSEADSQDPLDHLPPLDLPGEVTKSSATPPAPPAADRSAKPAENADKKIDVRRDAPAPAADDLDLTSNVTPAASPSIGPGINRFVAVDLKLAGGSAPSSDGLKWLADKGYRTVLDLRESSEVPPSFIAEVTGMGLRYVALPIGLKTIDRDHVDRFNFEIAAGEARPLFFFDADGTRAGALWYIHRIANDRIDHQIAQREARELGLTNNSYWGAATSFIDRLGGTQTTANSRSNAQGSTEPGGVLKGVSAGQKPGEAPANSTGTPVASPRDASQSSAQPAAAASAPAAAAITDSQGPQASASPTPPASVGLSESLAWRPFAAMVFTGLTVPLAYWSRTLPSAMLAKARASLPGPAHQPKSLPVESGA